MDHRELEESVAAYALGALADDELRRVEAALLEHLPGCESCRKMLADFREVAGDLALVADPRTAPREIEERLIASVGSGEQPRRPGAAAAPETRRSRRRPALRVAALATAAAIGALGAWNVQLAGKVDDARRQSRTVAAALSLVGAPDARAATLEGELGRLVFVYRAGEAVLVGHDVSAPASGRVLQLWLMRAGVPTSVAVFRPTDGILVVPVRVDPSGFDTVAITIERGPRGAPRPTRAPIYAGPLST